MLTISGQGHINPMLHLAKLLHSKGFYITFISPESTSPRQAPPLHEGFRFEAIPDGLPSPTARTRQNVVRWCLSTFDNCVAPFRDLLAGLNSSSSAPRITCIVYNWLFSFALDVAGDLGIPAFAFSTMSACGLMADLHMDELIQRGYTPLKDESYLTNGYLDTPIDWIPAMEGIRLRDLSSFVRTVDAGDYFFDQGKAASESSLGAKGLILNTFDSMEPEVLNALKLMFDNVYAIGPLPMLLSHTHESPVASMRLDLWGEDDGYMEWLDKQEEGSVMYVNFGSIITVSSEEVSEFAWGLANSMNPCLCVIRHGLVRGDQAVLPEDFTEKNKGRCDDDDSDFEEYNPHPYQGGYDIALTYGRPLPPSPATCYPISHAPGHLPELPAPPLPPPPPVEPVHLTEPQDPAPRPPSPPPPPPPVLDQPPAPTYDYGYRPEHYWPDPDVYGFWPFVSERWRRCGDGADAEEVGYWSQWKRAGDYLFGYLQGYGERRIGVDSYGIPIYADKKEASQPPLTLQMEPAMDLKVDCYENDTWISSYDKKVESYGHAYNKYYCEDPLLVEENLSEPMLHQRLAYHEVYEEPADSKLEWWVSSYDEKTAESYGNAYDKYYSQEPLIVEENLAEPILHQRLAFHEVYEEQAYPKLEWPTSCREYGDERNFYENHQYADVNHYKEQALCVELEPYKPTWSQNLNYQEFYCGEVSPEANHYFVAGNGVVDVSNFSREPNDAYTRQYHEQPNHDQLEPFKPSWAQNPSFYESCVPEVSQTSWVDDSVKEYGDMYFSPFPEYSHYDE